MRNLRLVVLGLLLGVLLFASYLTLRGLGFLGSESPGQVKAVPAGHQEVALLMPATASEMWERLVAAVRALENDWPEVFPRQPRLVADYERAFLSLTADVPELSLYFEDQPNARLWIRWYKLSSESTSHTWVDNLSKRSPPPLAIIGGDTSERANRLATVLQQHRERWRGSPPLFLITTATADRVLPGAIADPNPKDIDLYPKLTEVYPGLTYRFSFTNTLMAEAVIEFVQRYPSAVPHKGEPALKLWPHDTMRPDALVAACQTEPLASLGTLTAGWRPTALFSAVWGDDPYARDLAERFGRVFQRVFAPSPDVPIELDRTKNLHYSVPIRYSVGDFFEPNEGEVAAVNDFLESYNPDYNRLLLLPTNALRARRFLRDLYRRGPAKINNVLVVSGDSISINAIYRDGEVVWNFLDLPVPLLAFSHRDPVDESAGFGRDIPETGRPSKTSTQDLLLFRDVIEAMVQAGHADSGWLADAAQLRARLRQMEWRFHKSRKGRVFHPDFSVKASADAFFRSTGELLFDDEGNRRTGTGERIVFLQPDIVNATAAITFWRRAGGGDEPPRWVAAGRTLRLIERPTGATD